MELHLGYLQPNELLWTHSCFFFYSLVRDESITAFPLFCFFFFFLCICLHTCRTKYTTRRCLAWLSLAENLASCHSIDFA
jgi:hypothetical protein